MPLSFFLSFYPSLLSPCVALVLSQAIALPTDSFPVLLFHCHSASSIVLSLSQMSYV